MSRTALLLIDLQEAFAQIDAQGVGRNNPEALENVARLLHAARAADELVVHVRHASDEPGSPFREDAPGFAVLPAAAERTGEPVIVKRVNSAFIGTPLEATLRAAGVSRLTIAGATTNHCVETTARMAGNLGFATELVRDATWTYDRESPDGRRFTAAELHEVTLTNLSGEFASIVATRDVLGGLTPRTSGTRP